MGLIGDSQSAIQTTVTDAARHSIQGGIVALIPDERTQTEQYQVATSDQNGLFEFDCIRPGGYHLYAWTELDGAAYRNPEFMKPFDDRGEAVLIGDGTRASINPKVLNR